MFRNVIGLLRNPSSLIGRTIISVFVSLVSVSLFWKAGDEMSKADEVISSLFFISIAQLALY